MSAPLSADTRAVAGLGNELAKLQREVDLLKMGAAGSDLGVSSIEDGSLIIYDANGDPRTVIGKQDDGTYVGGTPVGFTSPPEVPLPPTVVAGFGTIKVMSHGSSDPPWPRDFSHVTVYLAKGVEGGEIPLEPGVPVGTIIGFNDSMLVISGLDPGVPYRVWLTSSNISGSMSEASDDVIATPTQVVGQDILDGAIDTLKLAVDAVTTAKIAAGAITSVQLGENSVDVTALASGAVEGQHIAAAAIASGHIAADQIRSNHIAAGEIQAGNIAVGGVQAENIAASAVTAEKILALSITADQLAANSITGGKIAAGSITSDHIRAGAIFADVTLETGVAGRRVQISGPGNEIRFYPVLGELKYSRIFTYISTNYPDDLTLEMRAINSLVTNVIPRIFLTPERAFMGITSAGDDTQAAGGIIDLQSTGAFFGHQTSAADTSGMEIRADGSIQFRGLFTSYERPNTNDAVMTWATLVTNASAGSLGAASFDWVSTMLSPMCPILTAGVPNALTSNPYNLTAQSNTTGISVGIEPSVPTGSQIRLFGWIFRVQSIYAQSV